MHIVTRKHLLMAAKRYPDAAPELEAWHKIAKNSRWRNFGAVRQTFADADTVDGYVIFNIRRNRYRLITIIHYSKERQGRLTEGHVYIRSVLTHKQYDDRNNWDKGIRK